MQFSSYSKTLAVFVERMSRSVVIVVNENKSASEMERAIHEMICHFGQTNLKTLTFDNGRESVCYQKVRESCVVSFDAFFCSPCCSWQKGSVENMNRLI
jgi:IS30 family transposase